MRKAENNASRRAPFLTLQKYISSYWSSFVVVYKNNENETFTFMRANSETHKSWPIWPWLHHTLCTVPYWNPRNVSQYIGSYPHVTIWPSFCAYCTCIPYQKKSRPKLAKGSPHLTWPEVLTCRILIHLKLLLCKKKNIAMTLPASLLASFLSTKVRILRRQPHSFFSHRSATCKISSIEY